MGYRVRYSSDAVKQMKKMDGGVRRLIYAYIDSRLNGIEDPRALGKGLAGSRAGQWRYRVGSYRILAKIKDDEVAIYIIKVGHRREVYGN
jgi:mRNA interferase RelE/StbE